LPDQELGCDLEHLEEMMLEHGDRVRGILFNNPSNPAECGFFGKDHLQDLVRFCDRHRLPIMMKSMGISHLDPMSFILS
jgi:bifunctional pyridoxal-dependent enzyme with beta-cystathionase and maltose regulon repressor activities